MLLKIQHLLFRYLLYDSTNTDQYYMHFFTILELSSQSKLFITRRKS